MEVLRDELAAAERAGDVHGQVQGFLGRAPRLPGSDDAERWLEHAASCAACAELIAAHSGHAQALVQAFPGGDRSDRAGPVPAVRTDEGAGELLMFARAVLGVLSAETRAAIAEPIPRELTLRLELPDEVSAEQFRAALAVSEVTAALSALLVGAGGSMPRAVVGHEQVQLEGRVSSQSVPAAYFAERVAAHAGVRGAHARALWDGIVQVALAGTVGLLGLCPWGECSDGTCTLVLEEDAESGAPDAVQASALRPAEHCLVAATPPFVPPAVAASPPAAAACAESVADPDASEWMEEAEDEVAG